MEKKIYPRKWYPQKVLLLDEKQRESFNQLKNEIMSYEGILNETTKYFDNFTYRNKMVFKLGAVGNTIKLYLALEPENYPWGQFPHRDMSHQKKHRSTPFLIKVSSELSMKRAMLLISDVITNKKTRKRKNYMNRDYISDMQVKWDNFYN